MSEEFLKTTQPANSSRIIAFEHAEVVPGIIEETYFLIVSGTVPYLNMTVSLSPLIYSHRPDYWDIEVVGTIAGGIGLPATKPYHVSLPLTGIIGTKGIRVIGANGAKQIDVP